MKTLKVGMLQEIQNWGLINSNSKQFTSTFGALDLSRKGLWISQRKETLIDKQTNKNPSFAVTTWRSEILVRLRLNSRVSVCA